jgi:hypothetical protein
MQDRKIKAMIGDVSATTYHLSLQKPVILWETCMEAVEVVK